VSYNDEISEEFLDFLRGKQMQKEKDSQKDDGKKKKRRYGRIPIPSQDITKSDYTFDFQGKAMPVKPVRTDNLPSLNFQQVKVLVEKQQAKKS